MCHMSHIIFLWIELMEGLLSVGRLRLIRTLLGVINHHWTIKRRKKLCWQVNQALVDHVKVSPKPFILTKTLIIFKASTLWANAFYELKCPYVCVFVCLLLRYHLNVFLPPLPKVGCPTFFRLKIFGEK